MQIKKQLLKFSVFLILTGCAGTTKVNQISADSFEINYTESAGLSSPALVQNYMNESAMESCPQGYEKLKEKNFKKEYMPTYIWTIKCL